MNAAAPPLTLKRRYDAAPEAVFDAWTDADRLRQWFLPGDIKALPVVEVDARVGGRFRIVMQGEEGEYDHTGEYRVVDRPAKLVFTWHSPATQFRESVVTITFEPDGDGTALTLVHEGLPDADTVEKHKDGWSSIVEKLAGYV